MISQQMKCAVVYFFGFFNSKCNDLQFFQYPGDEDAALRTGKTFWDIVADPRKMEKALDTENVDYNVTMAQTTR